jgi:hypothetical protein
MFDRCERHPKSARLPRPGRTLLPRGVPAQALARSGFSLTRDEWSLLALGHFGWIQVVNLVVTGAITIAGAVGVRRALGRSADAGLWAPRLLVGYGIALIAAGIFRADLADGFPPGGPSGASSQLSWRKPGRLVGVDWLWLPDRPVLRVRPPLRPPWATSCCYRLTGCRHRVRHRLCRDRHWGDECGDQPRIYGRCRRQLRLDDRRGGRPLSGDQARGAGAELSLTNE